MLKWRLHTIPQSASQPASGAASETRRVRPELFSTMRSSEKDRLQSDGHFNLNAQLPGFSAWVQSPQTSVTTHDATCQKRALGFTLSNPWFPVDADMVGQPSGHGIRPPERRLDRVGRSRLDRLWVHGTPHDSNAEYRPDGQQELGFPSWVCH